MIFSPQSDLNVIRHTQSTHSSVGNVWGNRPCSCHITLPLHTLYIDCTCKQHTSVSSPSPSLPCGTVTVVVIRQRVSLNDPAEVVTFLSEVSPASPAGPGNSWSGAEWDPSWDPS